MATRNAARYVIGTGISNRMTAAQESFERTVIIESFAKRNPHRIDDVEPKVKKLTN